MITHAANTWNPALLALRSKGYELWIVPTEDDESPTDYRARKEGLEFSATNPVALLGLVAMYESRGEEWKQKLDEPDLHDQLYETAYPGN